MTSLANQATHKHTLLKDIRPSMRRIDIEVIVLQQESETIVTHNGEMINRYLIADKSGVMILKAWGVTGGAIRSGDILRINGVDCKYNYGHPFLETSRLGKTKRLGQDTFPFAEGPNFSQQSETGSPRLGRLTTTTTTTTTPSVPGWTTGLDKSSGKMNDLAKLSDSTSTDGLNNTIRDPRKRPRVSLDNEMQRQVRRQVKYNEIV
ncbi:hypothetical protein BC941DRAFT_434492 [Chlamydoabsidia padenii]|nr:hypothetical protein BC941DRAFT_434492 [Chlamydoabsidia padenii]